MDTEKILAQATEIITKHGLKLVGAIVVWIIGIWVIKAVVNYFGKAMNKGSIDDSLKPFLRSMLGAILKVLLGLSVLGMVGIEVTSFIAVLGAAGLAVGLALSGTLQNFAGGVVLLIFKPFKVGDFIDAQGYTGTVSEIQIFNTILKTPDNKTVIIPNGGLSTAAMTNYTTEEKRRVDWTIGIGYGDDANKAEQVIRGLCNEDERILKDPEVFIAISELGDSSVNFTVRAWVNAPDYWGVYFAMNKKVYEVFAKEGLNIPFPQMDVHLHKGE